jgi:hypothetical protein
MPVPASIRNVFGHFQNLNLLALLHDLRHGRTLRQGWLSGSLLCPVAHGLPAGRHVRQVIIQGQAADLWFGCDYAARQLGADPDTVLRFVRSWDDESIGRAWLLNQLQELWDERLADADALQELLQGTSTTREPEDADADEWCEVDTLSIRSAAPCSA